jgi:GTPase SAR1 family protein
MRKINTILLIGACGSGKTWVMNELLKNVLDTKKAKVGLNSFRIDEIKKVLILGIYDGTTFEGSDKLSMGVMADVDKLKAIQGKHNLTIIAEGDRFTNATFIKKFNPFIIKISDLGEVGRLKRNSSQSERHIKSILTRVTNIKENILVNNSSDALEIIKKILTYEKN